MNCGTRLAVPTDDRAIEAASHTAWAAQGIGDSFHGHPTSPRCSAGMVIGCCCETFLFSLLRHCLPRCHRPQGTFDGQPAMWGQPSGNPRQRAGASFTRLCSRRPRGLNPFWDPPAWRAKGVKPDSTPQPAISLRDGCGPVSPEERSRLPATAAHRQLTSRRARPKPDGHPDDGSSCPCAGNVTRTSVG